MFPIRLPEYISSSELDLIRLQPEDASQVFYTYASKDQATRYLAWPTHSLVTDTNDFLTAVRNAWRSRTAFVYGIWLKPSCRLIGSIGLHRQQDLSFELGYVLSPVFWNQGLAKAAVSSLLPIAQHAGVIHISAVVHPDNQASVKLLISSGFQEFIPSGRTCVFPNISPEPVVVRVFNKGL